MAPSPGHPLSAAPVPHANAHSPNMYNPPRAPEVYTLADDAAIPKEVKEQFQCDDEGRLLFFTAPPVYRPHRSSELAALAAPHISRGPDIHQIRAERRAKRKARDEANAAAQRQDELEQAANKRRCDRVEYIASQKRRLLNKDALRELQARQEIQALISNPQALEKWAFAFKDSMDEGTRQIYADMGIDWEPDYWPPPVAKKEDAEKPNSLENRATEGPTNEN